MQYNMALPLVWGRPFPVHSALGYISGCQVPGCENRTAYFPHSFYKKSERKNAQLEFQPGCKHWMYIYCIHNIHIYKHTIYHVLKWYTLYYVQIYINKYSINFSMFSQCFVQISFTDNHKQNYIPNIRALAVLGTAALWATDAQSTGGTRCQVRNR